MGARACACCGYLTLDTEGLLSEDEIHFANFQNCEVCGWEDDYVARRYPHARSSNGMRLVDGQANFIRFGSYDVDRRHDVRQPRPDEVPTDAPWVVGP